MHRAIFTAAILTTTACGLAAQALPPATQPAPAASAATVAPTAPVAPVAPAPPADDLHSALSQIEQAPDPSAAVQAYAQSAAAHRDNADLERAYIHRMIQFGAPQLANAQAQDLARRNVADADAWTVCGYVAAQHRDLATAGADLKIALGQEPNNPFALRTAGQIVQWYDAQSDRTQISPQAVSAIEWLRTSSAHAPAFADAYRESAARQSPTSQTDQSSQPETIQNPYAEQTPPEDDQSAPVATYVAPTYSEPAQTYVATPVYPYSTYTYTSPYYGGYYYGGYTPWYGGYGFGRGTIIITGHRHDHHDNDHHDGDHHGDWNHHDAGNFHGGSGGDHDFHSSSHSGFVGPLPPSHFDHGNAGHFQGGHSSFHASPSNPSGASHGGATHSGGSHGSGSASHGGGSGGGGGGGSHGGHR